LSAGDKEPLHLVQTIPMPNVKGRIDHMDVDVKGKRLFVAALENGSLEVVDLPAGKWSKSIPGFKKTQGIAYVPSLNKVFVASGDDGMLRVFRGDSLDLLDAIKLDVGPNRVAYDPHTKLLYVGYGGKDAGKDYGEVGIIDANTDKHLGDVRVEAYPAELLLDKSGKTLFVFVSTASKVQVVSKSALLNELSTTQGVVDVFQQNDPDHYELISNVRSGIGIRTGYYFTRRDRFYVGVPAKGSEPSPGLDV
jgi:DNA-binding beta-propeller fold protein YncE